MKNRMLLICLVVLAKWSVGQEIFNSPLKDFVEGRATQPDMVSESAAAGNVLTSKKSEEQFVLSTVTSEYWNYRETRWELRELSESVYNGDAQLMATHYYDWDIDPLGEELDTETWVLDQSIHFAYNAMGLTAYREYEIHDPSTGQSHPRARVEYEYHDFGEERETCYLRWEEDLAQWERYAQENRYYQEQELNLLETHAISELTEILQAFRRVYYQRDDQGRAIVLELWDWEEELMEWQVKTRSAAVYDGEQMIELQYYSWDEETQEFNLDAFETRVYTENMQWAGGIYYRVEGESAVPLGQIALAYDDAGNREAEVYFTWYVPDAEEGGEAEWRPTRSNLYSYDEHNQRTSRQSFRWLLSSQNWLPLFRFSYEYVSTSTLAVDWNTELELQLYPNPSSDYISFSGPRGGGRYFLELMDAGGQVWEMGEVALDEPLSIAHLQEGVYIYRVWTESGVKTGKLLRSQ